MADRPLTRPAQNANITLATVLGDIVVCLSAALRGQQNSKLAADALQRLDDQRRQAITDLGDEPKDVITKDGKIVHQLRKGA